jgi:DNA-binding response OmpR family regulator
MAADLLPRTDHASLADRSCGTEPSAAYAPPMTHRVLVVEDEQELATPLVHTLLREGYLVTQVSTGKAALEAAPDHDIVILDLGLPDMDGLDVCRALRTDGYDGAVLIVTARALELDRVVGLDSGADDYLSKPFGLAELLARLRAILRRTSGRADVSAASQPANGLRVDVEAHRVYVGATEVPLTAKEFDVLSLLASHRDKVVSRGQLMADVWADSWYGSTKTLDVTIGRLRHKLEDAGMSERVVTVRGVGFRLETTPRG